MELHLNGDTRTVAAVFDYAGRTWAVVDNHPPRQGMTCDLQLFDLSYCQAEYGAELRAVTQAS